MKQQRRLLFIWWIIAVLFTHSLNGQELDTFLNKGNSLTDIGSYDSAIQAYNSALKKAIFRNDSLKIGNINLRLGIIFEKKSINSKALEFFFKSLAIFNALHLKDRIATVNISIGNVYRNVKNYKKAKIYLHGSLSQWLELKDSSKIPYALNNIGLIYLDQDSSEKAWPFFETILTTYGNHADNNVKYIAMSNIASLLMEKKQYHKALIYYKKCLEVTTGMGDRYETALLLNNISRLYRLMRDYKNALKSQQEGLKIAEKIGALELIRWAYYNYSQIHKEIGNNNKAYTAITKSMELQDSIYSEIKNEYRFEEENYIRRQKEIENISLVKENDLKQLKIENKDRLLMISLFVTGLILLTIFLFYQAYRARQTNERILQQQHTMILENQSKDWELTALRAQMNPHFIFNALSSIKSCILENNNKQADYYLSKFAKLMRLILDNSSQNFVSLEKEIQLLESYIELEQLRFENKFTYTSDIETEISSMEIFIPSMIIQPFVENAIVHGFLHKDGKCNLQINVRQHEKSLLVIIEDNGIGRLHAKKNPLAIHHESKGYSISEQRLKALSKPGATTAGITYKDLGDDTGNTGTRVEIHIPLQQAV